jgi:uncharacterized protein
VKRLIALCLIALAAMSGCATLDERQREWIFQPSDRSWWRGEEAAAGMQDVWIDFQSTVTGEPVRLHGLWAEHEDFAKRRDRCPVLLYLHGARFNVVGSAFRARRMQELGFSVLMVDYRGFGKSTPRLPSEAMAYEDARAAWDWLARAAPGPAPLYLRPFAGRRHRHRPGGAGGGRSRHAGRRHLHLDCRCGEPLPLGLAAGASPHHPALRGHRARLPHRFAPAGGARQRRPADPARAGPRLYDAANEPKAFVLVEGGSHHSTNAVGQGSTGGTGPLFGLGRGTSPAEN